MYYSKCNHGVAGGKVSCFKGSTCPECGAEECLTSEQFDAKAQADRGLSPKFMKERIRDSKSPKPKSTNKPALTERDMQELKKAKAKR